MSLPSFSLRRPVAAVVFNLFILLFGFLGFYFLGVREFPSVDQPVITVNTTYTGANPDIIESQITEPLEKSINGIAGIRTISSASNQGSSRISVEFDLEVDLDEAANEVRDKVSQAVRLLPNDIDGPPVVSKADANAEPILSMLVQSNTRSQLEVNDYATNVIQEKIQTIPGVSSVQIWGEKKYAMRIWLNPYKMAAFSITPAEVFDAIEKQNVELPAGKVTGLNTELTLKSYGRLSTPEGFARLVVRNQGDQLVRLGDIARIELGPEKEESILKESGIPMIALAIIPQPGTNYLDISEEFYRRYNQLKKEVPEDIRLDIALDTTQFIKNSINEVVETLIIAILLVVAIIYLFFRNWVIAFRPLIDIPVSLVGTFFVMYVLGYSINVLTLLAIVLATGLVVDDGIVVTENIFKKLEKGLNRRQAALEGAEEIYFAVIATSITLACVFLPVIFMDGFVGRLFREFGVVISVAVLISSFVSLTLTPVLTLWMQKEGTRSDDTWFYQVTEPFFQALNRGYQGTLEVFFQRKWQALLILFGAFGLTTLLYRSIPSELAPLEDRSQFRAIVSAPEGTSYELMYRYMDQLVKMVKDSVPENQMVLSVTAPGFFGSGAPNSGFMRIRLAPADQRNRSQQQIVNKLQADLSKLNTGRTFLAQDPTISTGMRVSRPIQFVIQNNDFEKIRAVLPRFLQAMAQSGVLIGPDADLKFNKPEIEIRVDREKAGTMGIPVKEIAAALQLAYSGRRFSYFTLGGKQYEVIGQLDRPFRNESADLSSIYIKNTQGEVFPLTSLVQLKETVNPPQLYHYNRYKSATLQADLAPGFVLGDGLKTMESIADTLLDDSFSTDLAGMSRDFKESSGNTYFALLLALLLVYLVLAVQFESFVDPLVVMMTVPLAFFGALFSLWALDMTLNIFSEIGIIMLIGLVTKNGILIVEFANQLQKEGREKLAAVKEAAIMRFRPIVMTSLATALGALPIALAFGAGAESRKPLGVVIIGGTLFSLVLTLYVIPAVYALLTKKKA
jgi:multidrug efflux pump